MKTSRLLPIVGAIVAALTVAILVEAQPAGPVGISRVTTNSPGLLAGSGTTTNPLTATIHTGGIISGTGSSGSPLTATEVGDISSVTAGTGMTGGGTSGAVTLNVDPTVVQSRVSSTCSAPNAIRAVAQDGTVTCTTGTGSVTSIDSGGGLTGGPVTTTGTFAVGAGTNITVNADDVQVANAFDQSASGKSTTVGDLRGTVITPTLSGDTNNWAPAGIATATVIEVTQSGGSWTITGLTTGVTGRFILISNVSGNGNELQIKHNSSNSSAGNKFWNTGLQDTRVSDGGGVWYHYDGALWRQTEQEYVQNFKVNGGLVVNGGSTMGGTTTMGAISGTIAVNNSGSLQVGDFRSGSITDTISADQNDYAPTGNATTALFDITPSGASRTITGLSNGVAGRRITIHNANVIGGFSIFLSSQNASSTATNRFITPDNITQTIYAKDSLNLFYNGVSSRWEVEKSKGFADIEAQTLGVNGVSSLGTTSTIGLLTASGGIAGNNTNTFNSTAGSSSFNDFRGGILSDTIAADKNDYVPPGATPTEMMTLDLTPTGVDRTITGITGGATGRFLYVHNASATIKITFTHQDTLSTTAADRFVLPGSASYVLQPEQSVLLWYSASRWNIYQFGDVGAGTANRVSKWSSTAGKLGDSGITDDGTTVSTSENVSLAGTTTSVFGKMQMVGSSGVMVVQDFRGTTITPTISADQNDWAPTNIDITTIIIATPSGATRTLTGLTGGTGGRLIKFQNADATYSVQFSNESGSSTSTNRFVTPGSATYTLRPGNTVDLHYNGTRWVIDTNQQFYDLTVQNNGIVSGTFQVLGATILTNISNAGNYRDIGTTASVGSCGSGATIAGGAQTGSFSVGTGATGCTVTHATALTGTPSCTVTSRSNKHFTYTVSTTALTLTNVDDLSSTTLDYECVGH